MFSTTKIGISVALVAAGTATAAAALIAAPVAGADTVVAGGQITQSPVTLIPQCAASITQTPGSGALTITNGALTTVTSVAGINITPLFGHNLSSTVSPPNTITIKPTPASSDFGVALIGGSYTVKDSSSSTYTCTIAPFTVFLEP